MEKKDVFISYSSIETEEAHIIKGVLEKNGISCWMAPESIPIGSNYTKEIPEAISNCSAFLVLLSRNAIKSNWVPLELDRAYNEGKRIIPFFIEKCSLTDDFNFMLAKSERIEAYHRKAEALGHPRDQEVHDLLRPSQHRAGCALFPGPLVCL